MKNKSKENLLILIILNSSLILFGVIYTLIFTFKKELIMDGACSFQERFRLYCPGCGGSRSLACFMRLDLINSFIYYPPITVSAIVLIDYDRRLLTSVIKGKDSYISNFKYYTFLLIPISIILTFIIRNILLLFFGIDTVGDFIP